MLGLFIAQHAENDKKSKQLAAHIMKDMKSAQTINIVDSNLTDFGKKVQENFVTHVLEHAFLSLKKDLTACIETKEPIAIERMDYTKILEQRIDQTEFYRSIARTWWGNELTENHLQKLFWLARGRSRTDKVDNPTISLLTYVQILLWLGHPSFKESLIPAPASIDLLYEIISTHVTFHKLFFGSLSRAQLDKNKTQDPRLRLNEGHITFNEDNQMCFLFRNLVITDYNDNNEHHRCIFSINKIGLIVETDESWKTRYVRRKNDPKPDDPRERTIDIRDKISAVNKKYQEQLQVSIQKQSIEPNSYLSTLLESSCAMLSQTFDSAHLPQARGNREVAIPFDLRRGLPI